MISIIVPARNAESSIAQCLDALLNQTMDASSYEIIVVDNGSADRTAEIAEQQGAQLLREDKRGAAAARNRGIRAASGEIICFTDADCLPTESWLEEMISPFSDPQIAGCKGSYLTRQHEIVARFVQIEYEDKYDRLLGLQNIDFIDTYSAAYRRNVLVSVGGFDESIYYVEDQELSFRVARLGKKMVFQPSAAVYHSHSNSFWKYFKKKFMIAYWKAQILRRPPGKAINDSHTPQTMKIQIALVASLGLAAAAALFISIAWLIFALLSLLFLFSTAPFVIKAWGKDKLVALISPVLLLGRAIAQTLGIIWSTLRPPKNQGSVE
jgi:glycosyltransferase involved in cell wall biosynthesis